MIAGILIVIVILASLVVWAACALSSQCDDMIDRTGDGLYPDHRDHRSTRL